MYLTRIFFFKTQFCIYRQNGFQHSYFLHNAALELKRLNTPGINLCSAVTLHIYQFRQEINHTYIMMIEVNKNQTYWHFTWAPPSLLIRLFWRKETLAFDSAHQLINCSNIPRCGLMLLVPIYLYISIFCKFNTLLHTCSSVPSIFFHSIFTHTSLVGFSKRKSKIWNL